MLTSRFEDALAFATHLHRSQVRKGTAIPYASHLLAVASLAIEMGADEDQAIAALLHDAIEDQGLEAADIAERYGAGVAEIVGDCTDTGHVVRYAGEDDVSEWRRRKRAYLASMETKPVRSLMVSLADKTHNARAILDDVEVLGAEAFARFTAGQNEVLCYYRSLGEVFARRLGGPASKRFTGIVNQLHQRAA